MTAFLAIASIVLIVVVLIQIGKISELARKIRGEEEAQYATNRVNGSMMLWFMVFFLAFCVWSAIHYKNLMLGYGPLESASAHGGEIDSMFNVTLFFTGLVFIATQVALFYFAWKYRGRKGHKADFYPHDDRLELLWTGVPAVVMTFLVIRGLIAWNEIMVDIPADAVPGKDYIEVEATGSQFLWYLRYPGPDHKLGARDYRKITATNPLGQDWTDEANLDDFQPTDLVLPVGKPVRVRITSRDVLHNFYLPHFRVKMDAVPGMPTFFVFTPTMTTEEYRRKLGERDEDGNPKYPEWWEPTDPNDPESEPRWKTFNFELACAELCGKGHFSMRKIVRVVTEEEYEQWLQEQQSYYFSTIRGTEEDPHVDKLFPQEIEQLKQDLNSKLEEALSAAPGAQSIPLPHINFVEGSAQLAPISHYELDALAEALKKYSDVRIEIAGHTDDTGNAEANQELSQARAQAVADYLINNKGIDATRLVVKGYGATQPVDTNDTEAGRAANRRVEIRIMGK